MRSGVVGSPAGWLRLADVAAQRGAYLTECGVQAAGQSFHAGRRAERNQSNNKGILNQVLTVLAVRPVPGT